MTAKRFTTNGYYIYDHFKEDKWLVNEVEAQEIVDIMNNLDTKARERSKALSKLQKENEELKERNQRQAKRLAELYELMAKKDWESLTEIIDDFCSCEEQLQREWRTYE